MEVSVGELRERTAGELEKESDQYLPFLSMSQPGQSVAASPALGCGNNSQYYRVHCLLPQDGQDCSLGRPGGAPGSQQASQQTNRGER